MNYTNTILDLTVVIPFKNKSGMTLDCLKSLLKYAPAIRDVLLVSNNSSAAEMAIVKKEVDKHSNVRLLIYNKPFNYQSINNWAIRQSDSKVLMLLNNDIELVPESKSLIGYMYEQSLRKGIGAVGAVLLYEDQRTIQHAGVYLVPGATADHIYIGKSFTKTVHACNNNALPYNIVENLDVSAVTAAALMVERKKFNQINGMDENFIICGGDVDLCLRLADKGHQSLLAGASHGYMIHKESKSRSMLSVPYVDFFYSYSSYVRHLNKNMGDRYIDWEKIKNV